MKRLYLVTLAGLLTQSDARSQWQLQPVSTDANFRGLCAVNANVAWVSGTKGTFARTVDAGKTWTAGQVPGCDKLDFRDVEAFGTNTAYLMSAGPGAESKIYKTTDGGKTWVLQFTNQDPEAFYDAIAFWDEKHGIALSDPVKGRFPLLVTDDGGARWQPLTPQRLPPALPKEGAFAASGTCLVTRGSQDVWFCTGGARVGRVFHSADRGQNWTVSETPVPGGAESAGIFSLAFADASHGVAVGGDYTKPAGLTKSTAITVDGGKTWQVVGQSLPYASAVARAKDGWVTVGTAGSYQTRDDGKTWTRLDGENYNSVAFTPSGEGWAAGPKGRIAKFVGR